MRGAWRNFRAAYPSAAPTATLLSRSARTELAFFGVRVRVAPLLEDALGLPVRFDRSSGLRAAGGPVPRPVPGDEHSDVARRVDEGGALAAASSRASSLARPPLQ